MLLSLSSGKTKPVKKKERGFGELEVLGCKPSLSTVVPDFGSEVN